MITIKPLSLCFAISCVLSGIGTANAAGVTEGARRPMNAPGTDIMSMPGRSVISADGGTVVYLKQLDPADETSDLKIQNLMVEDMASGQTIQVSNWGRGNFAQEPSAVEVQRLSIDRTGTYIAFEVIRSNAPAFWLRLDQRIPSIRGNYIDGYVPNGRSQVYVAKIRNATGALDLGSISLISESLTDRANSCSEHDCFGGNDDSFAARISADGNYVAFASTATDLVSTGVTPATDAPAQLFRWNRLTDAIEQVTTQAKGVDSISISGDGNTIVFETQGNGQEPRAIYSVKNQQGAWLAPQLVSHALNQPNQVANGDSGTPWISLDGTTIAFDSQASNLLDRPNLLPGIRNIFVYDVATQNLDLVSEARVFMNGGFAPLSPADGDSEAAMTSNDGRYVTFRSKATNLVPCYPHSRDPYEEIDADGHVIGRTKEWVYLWDRTTHRTTVLSENQDTGSVAGDGRYTVLGDILVGGTVERLEGVGKLWDGQARTIPLPNVPNAVPGGSSSTLICGTASLPTVSWCTDQPAAVFTWGSYAPLTIQAGSAFTETSTPAPRVSIHTIESSTTRVSTTPRAIVWPSATEAAVQRFIAFQVSAEFNRITGTVNGQANPLALPGAYQVALSVSESCHAEAQRTVPLTVTARPGTARKPEKITIDLAQSGIDIGSLATQFPLGWVDAGDQSADAVLVLRATPDNQLTVIGLYEDLHSGNDAAGRSASYINVPIADIQAPPRAGRPALIPLDQLRIALVRNSAGTSPLSD